MARISEHDPYIIGRRVTVHEVEDVAAYCKEGDTGTIVGYLLEGGILVKVDNPYHDDKVLVWAFEPRNLELILPKGSD